jgi:protein involved in polysaccharide export with SLBB domain
MKAKRILLLILILFTSVPLSGAQSNKEKQVVFVYGEVEKEGEYLFTEGLTLRAAIALAEGITFDANTQRAYLFHEHPTKEEPHRIRVNLGGILSGKAPDIALRPNDMIVVLANQGSRYK